jgi:hypothetical protein
MHSYSHSLSPARLWQKRSSPCPHPAHALQAVLYEFIQRISGYYTCLCTAWSKKSRDNSNAPLESKYPKEPAWEAFHCALTSQPGTSSLSRRCTLANKQSARTSRQPLDGTAAILADPPSPSHIFNTLHSAVHPKRRTCNHSSYYYCRRRRRRKPLTKGIANKAPDHFILIMGQGSSSSVFSTSSRSTDLQVFVSPSPARASTVAALQKCTALLCV